jgi:hypothetical protein
MATSATNSGDDVLVNCSVTNTTAVDIPAAYNASLNTPIFRRLVSGSTKLAIARLNVPTSRIPLTKTNIPFETWAISLSYAGNAPITAWVPQLNPPAPTTLGVIVATETSVGTVDTSVPVPSSYVEPPTNPVAPETILDMQMDDDMVYFCCSDGTIRMYPLVMSGDQYVIQSSPVVVVESFTEPVVAFGLDPTNSIAKRDIYVALDTGAGTDFKIVKYRQTAALGPTFSQQDTDFTETFPHTTNTSLPLLTTLGVIEDDLLVLSGYNGNNEVIVYDCKFGAPVVTTLTLGTADNLIVSVAPSALKSPATAGNNCVALSANSAEMEETGQGVCLFQSALNDGSVVLTDAFTSTPSLLRLAGYSEALPVLASGAGFLFTGSTTGHIAQNTVTTATYSPGVVTFSWQDNWVIPGGTVLVRDMAESAPTVLSSTPNLRLSGDSVSNILYFTTPDNRVYYLKYFASGPTIGTCTARRIKPPSAENFCNGLQCTDPSLTSMPVLLWGNDLTLRQTMDPLINQRPFLLNANSGTVTGSAGSALQLRGMNDTYTDLPSGSYYDASAVTTAFFNQTTTTSFLTNTLDPLASTYSILAGIAAAYDSNSGTLRGISTRWGYAYLNPSVGAPRYPIAVNSSLQFVAQLQNQPYDGVAPVNDVITCSSILEATPATNTVATNTVFQNTDPAETKYEVIDLHTCDLSAAGSTTDLLALVNQCTFEDISGTWTDPGAAFVIRFDDPGDLKHSVTYLSCAPTGTRKVFRLATDKYQDGSGGFVSGPPAYMAFVVSETATPSLVTSLVSYQDTLASSFIFPNPTYVAPDPGDALSTTDTSPQNTVDATIFDYVFAQEETSQQVILTLSSNGTIWYHNVFLTYLDIDTAGVNVQPAIIAIASTAWLTTPVIESLFGAGATLNQCLYISASQSGNGEATIYVLWSATDAATDVKYGLTMLEGPMVSLLGTSTSIVPVKSVDVTATLHTPTNRSIVCLQSLASDIGLSLSASSATTSLFTPETTSVTVDGELWTTGDCSYVSAYTETQPDSTITLTALIKNSALGITRLVRGIMPSVIGFESVLSLVSIAAPSSYTEDMQPPHAAALLPAVNVNMDPRFYPQTLTSFYIDDSTALQISAASPVPYSAMLTKVCPVNAAPASAENNMYGVGSILPTASIPSVFSFSVAKSFLPTAMTPSFLCPVPGATTSAVAALMAPGSIGPAGDYTIWSFQEYVNAINACFTTLWNAITDAYGGTLPAEQMPPLMRYDPSTRKYSLSLDTTFSTGPFEISFNYALHTIFRFPLQTNRQFTATVTGKLQTFYRIFLESILAPPTSATGNARYYSILQEGSSQQYLFDFARIVIRSISIPVTGDFETNAQVNSITDVEVDITNFNFNGYEIYEPFFYRPYPLQQNQPLYNLNIEVWYENNSGVRSPLLLAPGESASFKLIFLRK